MEKLLSEYRKRKRLISASKEIEQESVKKVIDVIPPVVFASDYRDLPQHTSDEPVDDVRTKVMYHVKRLKIAIKQLDAKQTESHYHSPKPRKMPYSNVRTIRNLQ